MAQRVEGGGWVSDEPDAVHYAAQRICAYMDAREGRLTRDWRFISEREKNAALELARAMKQAALEP